MSRWGHSTMWVWHRQQLIGVQIYGIHDGCTHLPLRFRGIFFSLMHSYSSSRRKRKRLFLVREDSLLSVEIVHFLLLVFFISIHPIMLCYVQLVT